MRLLSIVLCLLAIATTTKGREPAEEFLHGLEERGLHELALDYLDQLKTSPLADAALRKKVPYLRGVALIEESRQSPDTTARNRLLDEARQELEKYAEANPHSVQAAEAELQLANVQLSRGQELVMQAGQLPKGAAYAAERRSIGRNARVMFAEARETFGRAETIYSDELEKLPPTTSAEARGNTGTLRQEYRSRVAQLRFLTAQTHFEEAESYPEDADEFRKTHESAAQEMAAIYDEFARTMLVGLYARLYEGRCYQAIGKTQEALGCYDEIIGKDNVLPQFRKLIASAIQRKAELLISEKKLDAAIEACRLCLKNAHPDEEKEPEFLAVRYQFAEALKKKSDALPSDSAEQRKVLVQAREAYRMVAKSPGEFQVPARLAAAVTSGKKSGDEKREEPKTFQAAYDLGKEAISSYNTAKMAIPSAEKNNPPAVPELQEQMNRGKEDARHYFQIALTLVEADTDPKLLNEIRYFLCWFYWESEDYYRAAVMGEFLARRYPDHPAASSAAKIAMASFERLYGQALANGKKDNGDFEARNMAEMAQLITRRWPKTEDADSAFAVLVSYSIRSGRIEDAERLVNEASAATRPRLELQLGNAMWARYLEVAQADVNNANAEANDKLKAAAIKHIRVGLEAARNDQPVSDQAAMGALYVAQSLAADGKYAEVLSQLKDEKLGPLTLIAAEQPAATRPPYEIEAYQLALRSYVSATPPDDEKAAEMMQSLERVVKSGGDAAKAAEQLNRIYIVIGVALQKQIEDSRAAGRQADAKLAVNAASKFLDRIQAQPSGANWATRVWLAQMYFTLAQPDEANERPLNAAQKTYLAKSRDIYQQLTKEAADNAKAAPNDKAVIAAKFQLGQCYRALGQYQLALDTFSEILKDREMSLEVQRLAALTYQDRGQREDPSFFENAIRGGIKLPSTGQNRIWGWLKISSVAARASRTNPTFRDAFFEARYNIGRCRYLAAMKKTGDARKKDLTTADEGVQSFVQQYPDMGGEKWKPKFEQLMKEIHAQEKSTE